jgi:hypothetical protein
MEETETMTNKAVLKQLNIIMARMSKERDRLEDLKNEIDSDVDAVREAHDAVQSAIDYLSERV